MDGDVKNSTFSETLQKAQPDKLIQGYIAEQNLVSVAVGMAAQGLVPFVDTFACFLSRAYDQVRMAAISRSNINLCGSHCGVSIGEDGPSQMALEDLAMFRAIPGAAVFYPADAVAAERLTEEAARRPGICYIRTSRPKTAVPSTLPAGEVSRAGTQGPAPKRDRPRHRDRCRCHPLRSAQSL